MNNLPAAIRPPANNREEAKSGVSWRRVAVAGYVLIFVTFGVIGGWAAVTKIDRAVAAPGVVAIETNRKTVEHFEGGIVREILVKEGDAVDQGTVLFRLENVQAKANYQEMESQLYTLLATEARLIAERDQKAEITWPDELVAPDSDGAFDSHITADQVAEFDKRRSSLQGQVEVLKSRIEQLGDEIRGTQLQKDSAQGQIEYINKELVGLRELYEKNLVPVSRLYAMERERERLNGVIGEGMGNIAKSNGAIGEIIFKLNNCERNFKKRWLNPWSRCGRN